MWLGIEECGIFYLRMLRWDICIGIMLILLFIGYSNLVVSIVRD